MTGADLAALQRIDDNYIRLVGQDDVCRITKISWDATTFYFEWTSIHRRKTWSGKFSPDEVRERFEILTPLEVLAISASLCLHDEPREARGSESGVTGV